MKKYIYFACMVFASTTSYAVEPKTITSKVDAVTVYYDRALVTRSGNISLQTGMQSVVFGGLPGACQSVRWV